MIAADPKQTVEISLANDADVPPEQRPVFVYRHFTSAELSERRQLIKQAIAARDDEQQVLSLTAKVVGIGLAGWRNVRHARTGQPVPFDPPNHVVLHQCLTDGELWEIITATPRAMELAAEAKKKSASPSSSVPASSVATAQSPAGA